MYARLDVIANRLEWLGLTHRTYYRRMLHRIAGSTASAEEFAALETLADQLEPVKDYTREETATVEATSFSPLNRVVDAIPLESDAGRHFAELVDEFISASCLAGDAGERLRAQFTSWRDNDAKLQSLAHRSFLVKEVSVRSQDLSSLGVIGLAALEAIAKRQPAPDSWKTQQLAALEEMKKGKVQLLLIPVPAVQKLVEAAATGGTCMGGK